MWKIWRGGCVCRNSVWCTFLSDSTTYSSLAMLPVYRMSCILLSNTTLLFLCYSCSFVPFCFNSLPLWSMFVPLLIYLNVALFVSGFHLSPCQLGGGWAHISVFARWKVLLVGHLWSTIHCPHVFHPPLSLSNYFIISTMSLNIYSVTNKHHWTVLTSRH